MAHQSLKNSANFLKNLYMGVLVVADYIPAITISKFEMAGWMYQNFEEKKNYEIHFQRGFPSCIGSATLRFDN